MPKHEAKPRARAKGAHILWDLFNHKSPKRQIKTLDPTQNLPSALYSSPIVEIAYSSSIDDLQWCTRRLRAVSRERIIDSTPSALGFNAEVTTDHTCLDRTRYSLHGGHLAAEGSAAREWQRAGGGGEEAATLNRGLLVAHRRLIDLGFWSRNLVNCSGRFLVFSFSGGKYLHLPCRNAHRSGVRSINLQHSKKGHPSSTPLSVNGSSLPIGHATETMVGAAAEARPLVASRPESKTGVVEACTLPEALSKGMGGKRTSTAALLVPSKTAPAAVPNSQTATRRAELQTVTSGSMGKLTPFSRTQGHSPVRSFPRGPELDEGLPATFPRRACSSGPFRMPAAALDSRRCSSTSTTFLGPRNLLSPADAVELAKLDEVALSAPVKISVEKIGYLPDNSRQPKLLETIVRFDRQRSDPLGRLADMPFRGFVAFRPSGLKDRMYPVQRESPKLPTIQPSFCSSIDAILLSGSTAFQAVVSSRHGIFIRPAFVVQPPAPSHRRTFSIHLPRPTLAGPSLSQPACGEEGSRAPSSILTALAPCNVFIHYIIFHAAQAHPKVPVHRLRRSPDRATENDTKSFGRLTSPTS
ncbi:hypothetical protein R3P38DRAFT_3170317 [Favolaschia claudopus]|uniref:Uncharacterized protein n=1 Tax=Favolaschia claudopus TaxID=2862362 RepID=A0AAW0DWZ2_9AGAR